jgi:hypothetical protein
MMRPLRTDADYLGLVARNACSAALARAVSEGTYTTPREVILPGGNHGWEFEVMNDRGSKWAVTIELLEKERKYRVHSHKVQDD